MDYELTRVKQREIRPTVRLIWIIRSTYFIVNNRLFRN